jgi:hypothetical protein
MARLSVVAKNPEGIRLFRAPVGKRQMGIHLAGVTCTSGETS